MKYFYAIILSILWAVNMPAQSPGPNGPLQGGETVATAVVLSGPLPINSSGSTSGHINDYDEVCDYFGSTAPDVVYSYTPPANILVDFDLCGSNYDTKIYVYENTVTPGNPFACNDDFYYSETCGEYTSFIEAAYLTAGNTYYIVIDGYETASGHYELAIKASNSVPCEWGVDLTCPPISVDESEDCSSNSNNGCNMVPGSETWEIIPSTGAIVCGTFWAYFGFHDEDWYELVLTDESVVSLTANGDRKFLYGVIETTTPGAPDCSTLTGDIFPSDTAGPCTESSIDLGTLQPGTYWFYVGMIAVEGYVCPNHYFINFEVAPVGCPPPESLLASNITSSTADLGWIEMGTATAWEYQVGPEFFVPAESGTATANNPKQVTGLSSNTTYDFYVRSSCGFAFSPWSGPFNFTTTCDGVVVFPWSESFESTWPPACWDDPDASAYGWDQSTYGFEHTGSEWAYCNKTGAVLTTPQFLLPENAWLVFYYKAEDAGVPQNLTVKANNTVIYQVTGATNLEYELAMVSLSSYIGQTITLSFTGGTGSGGTDSGICLDDVSVKSGFNWTGNISTSWENPGNWNISGIPDQNDIVLIPSTPSGGRFPVVNNSITAECYNIKVETGASIGVKTGGLLNVKNP
jgi:hypothetical protein